jgi:SAM-dependent methyltransferase
MTVFGDYARHYELLYRDKDYGGEARFVKGLLDRHAPGATSILEFGCGAGQHAALLAEMGLAVHGIDRSPEMIEAAHTRMAGLSTGVTGRLWFDEGDIRSLALGRTFDAVVSLFHVVSYQTTNADLRATFAAAARHLRPGGIFLFDCWYGPTVLTEPPVVRVKRMEDETVSATRLSEPEVLPNENAVIVNYTVFIEEKATGAIRTIRESHRMRYLFTPEVDDLFADARMERIDSAEWMTGRPPGLHTFGVFFAGRKTA